MKKTKLSRVRKYFVYKTMKERIESYRKNYCSCGFCVVLPSMYVKRPSNTDDIERAIETYFPELWKYKPEKNEDYSFWFHRTDYEKRLHILNIIMLRLESEFDWFDKLKVKLHITI